MDYVIVSVILSFLLTWLGNAPVGMTCSQLSVISSEESLIQFSSQCSVHHCAGRYEIQEFMFFLRTVVFSVQCLSHM